MEETNTNLAENTSTTAVEETEQEETTSPVKQELEKINKKGKTELEKALFTKAQIEKRIIELGGAQETDSTEDDNKPLTQADLNRFKLEEAQKTATTLADSITDADERELTKHYLKNTIKPSGDPQEDLRTALALVHAKKNTQIVEEITRTSNFRPSSSVSSAGQPARQAQKVVLTADEAMFKKAYGLTDEQIIEARRKSEQK